MDQSSVILLVEDNEDDIFIMQRALKKAGVTNPIQIVMDGQSAINYLSGENEFSDRANPLPGFVFLDLKLPYKDGFEVLAWLSRQSHFNQLQIAVLTSSPENRDKARAFELGAKFYLVKPPTAEILLSLLSTEHGKPELAGNY